MAEIDQQQIDYSGVGAYETAETHRDDIVGNIFKPTVTSISQASFYMTVVGSPPQMRAVLYAATAVDGVPTGSPLAIGSYVTLPAGSNWVDFPISYDSLNTSNYYAIMYEFNPSGGTLDGSNQIGRHGDNGQNLYADGRWVYSSDGGSNWSGTSTWDCSFKTWYEEEAPPAAVRGWNPK